MLFLVLCIPFPCPTHLAKAISRFNKLKGFSSRLSLQLTMDYLKARQYVGLSCSSGGFIEPAFVESVLTSKTVNELYNLPN